MKTDTELLNAEHRRFGPTHIIEPTSHHTHTTILLHGRGSTGVEFAEDLLDTDSNANSPLSSPQPPIPVKLAQRFPGCRWVFPSSPSIWNATFEEDMPRWFDIHSLTDPTVQQDCQILDLRDSIRHVLTIVDDETARLGDESKNVVLGGISQGGAVAIWTLFARCVMAEGDPSTMGAQGTPTFGAFVGVSTWLPFAAEMESHLSCSDTEEKNATGFVAGMLGIGRRQLSVSTPVFLGHGVDDTYVDIELGRQAKRVVTQAGFNVQWKEYSGAEQEGHWLKEPEEVDDIAHFLATHLCTITATCENE
ncbi:Alpha/Beta hydrolase protein [Phaeosphaeriaceae sp. PMI808]|nr:Alpha/Beta hydrolase protein [Phaeosphaeriaceae sp. PMI808]